MSKYLDAADHGLSTVSDDELRRAFGHLFEDIQSQADEGLVTIVVLTARRMACTYLRLIASGMPELTGCSVVMDRFFDAVDTRDRDWSQEHVLIVDDTIVVGTTLFDLHESLQEVMCHEGTIRCAAVCKDSDSSVDFLLNDLSVDVRCERRMEEVNRLSKQLVITLFEAQVPFFSDFAYTKPIEFSAEAWSDFLRTPGWQIADVTSPFQALHDGVCGKTPLEPVVESFSVIPDESVVTRVLSRTTLEAAQMVEAFKLRLYARQLPDGSRSVVVLPLALVAPSYPDSLRASLHAITRDIRGGEELFGVRWTKWKPVAWHRLVQLYLSACVLSEVWERIVETSNAPERLTRDAIESRQVELYFGESSSKILDAFEKVVDGYRFADERDTHATQRPRHPDPSPSSLLLEDDVEDYLWEGRELLSSGHLPERPDSGHLTKVGLIFLHVIWGVFGYVNREHELPQRRDIKALPDLAEYQEWRSQHERVLKRGFTLRELIGALAPSTFASSSVWWQSVLSLGIDTGNDLGIIVPVTRHDEVRDVVFRYYRIGESAFLADQPLGGTVLEDPPTYDIITKASLRIVPICSEVQSIDGGAVPETGGSAEELARSVRAALPGRVFSKYVGVITSIEETHFSAEVQSPTGSEQGTADVPLALVSAAQQPLLRLGARFEWTSFLPSSDDDLRTRIRITDPAAALSH
ncbi:MAG: hypothetical protein GY798_09315 [Hyphomicrobiales bacterium]|nr:hypothetical protein [Hyphomicrobiales bacterium]